MGRERFEERRVGGDRGVRARFEFYAALWAELAEQPYEAITVESILRRTGSSRGRFYHHFADKEDLVRKAYRAHTQETVAQLTHALEQGWSLEQAALHDLMRLIRELGTGPVRSVLEMEYAAMRDPSLREILAADYEAKVTAGAKVARADIRRGVLKKSVKPRQLIAEIYAGVFGLYLLHLALDQQDDLADKVDRLVKRLIAGARV